jgi:hypothetical protein
MNKIKQQKSIDLPFATCISQQLKAQYRGSSRITRRRCIDRVAWAIIKAQFQQQIISACSALQSATALLGCRERETGELGDTIPVYQQSRSVCGKEEGSRLKDVEGRYC